MERTIAIILGGGRGTRLHPLTRFRSKPAVPFGGMYRLIDIPVSNSVNSGIYRLFVVTQFNSASLNRHIALTYNFDAFREGFVTVLAAEQTLEHAGWYQGTADAVRKNLRHIRPTHADDVLILSGDHIYRMDYRVMIALHRQTRADVTLAVQPVRESEIDRLGIVRMNAEGRVIDFCEKPAHPSVVHGWDLSEDLFENESIPGRGPIYMASLGIYLIRQTGLESLLAPDSGTDFGRDIMPHAMESYRVYAYPFSGYWEDIGTIAAYYRSNLDLTEDEPKFELFDPQMKLFTRPRFLPGARIGQMRISRSLLCMGVRAAEGNVDHSIVGLRAILKNNVMIQDSIIVGSDYYETPDELAQNRELERPDIGIGGDTVIRRAIVDKNARIGYGVTIDPGSECPDVDGDGFAVRDGIVVVEKDAVVPDGRRIPERR